MLDLLTTKASGTIALRIRRKGKEGERKKASMYKRVLLVNWFTIANDIVVCS